MEEYSSNTLYKSEGMLIKEDDNYYTLRLMVLPSLKIRLLVYGRRIDFIAEKSFENKFADSDFGFFSFEKSGEKFRQTIPLKKEVDIENIRIDYHNNILSEIIPKKNELA